MSKARKVGPFGQHPPNVVFFCNGCGHEHAIPYTNVRPHVPGRWFFDENFESPTIEPSLLVFGWDGKTHECHVVITNGVLNYQSDCAHSLAGQSVPMQDVKENPHDSEPEKPDSTAE